MLLHIGLVFFSFCFFLIYLFILVETVEKLLITKSCSIPHFGRTARVAKKGKTAQKIKLKSSHNTLLITCIFYFLFFHQK